jgi:hypothetical protein
MVMNGNNMGMNPNDIGMNRPRYNLIFTTSLFAVPSVYGFYKKQYVLSSVSLVCMAASINYWRHPIPGTRKNIDLWVSKSSVVIYFIYGYTNVNTSWMRLIGYANGILMASAYNTSCVLHKLKNDTWEYYHMLFHVASVVGKILVLSYHTNDEN